MEPITTFEQADALAKKQESYWGGNTVAPEPKVIQGKTFWQVIVVDKDTKEPKSLRGGVTYISDKGQFITLGSSDQLNRRDELLLQAYDREDQKTPDQAQAG